MYCGPESNQETAEIMVADVAIVTAADRRFLPAACCQLVSVSENLPKRDAAQLFLIVIDVEPSELKKVEEFFRRRKLFVHILAPRIDKILAHPTSKSITSATYIRLYFDEIFDARWSRIIYFDADTRVCANLGPLLGTNLGEKPLGAVHDYFLYVTGRVHDRRQTLGLGNDAAYFNAGVVIFDWPLTLSKQKLSTARRIITDYPERCLKHDQDALNAAFEDDWTPLDPRWNLYHAYFVHGGSLSPFVTHFTGPKPWSQNRLPVWREATRWYQENLRESGWPDFVESQSHRDEAQIPAKPLITRKKNFSSRLRQASVRRMSKYAPFVLDLLGKSRATVGSASTQRRSTDDKPIRSSDVERIVQALITEAQEGCLGLRPPEAALDN